MVFASVPLTRSANDISVLVEGDLDATESNSDLRPLEPPRFAVSLLSVPDREFSAVSKRVMNPTATS